MQAGTKLGASVGEAWAQQRHAKTVKQHNELLHLLEVQVFGSLTARYASGGQRQGEMQARLALMTAEASSCGTA